MRARRLTEESTRGEDGDDEGLARGRDVVAIGTVVGVDNICRTGTTEELEPVGHGDDTRDGTGVVAEEDTTEGGEGGHTDASKLVLGGIGTDASASRDGTTGHGSVQGRWWRWKEVREMGVRGGVEGTATTREGRGTRMAFIRGRRAC